MSSTVRTSQSDSATNDGSVTDRMRVALRTSYIRLAILAFAALVAAAAYGRASGLVYPEYSDFALEFGRHAWYHALTFGQILEEYFALGHGWYRPTGFYLIPYLLRTDYFEPGGQVSVDIGTLVIASAMILLLFSRLRVLPALIGVLAVLLAPALYQVTYGAQADSFYIIFAMAFLLVADRLFRGDANSRDTRLLRIALVLTYLLTITTKEVGAGVAFVLVPFLIIRQPQLTRASVIRALRFAAPFLISAVLFAIVYRTQVSSETGTYSTHPSFDRMLNAINLISWTFGFRSPRHTFTQWIPAWSGGERALAIALLATLVVGLGLTWRTLKPWRIGIYVMTALLIALAIAAVGGIPYHGYPLIVMYGIALIVVTEGALARVEVAFGRIATLVGSIALLVLVGAQLVQGYRTFGDALYRGPHTAYLEASTELFDGSTIAPVSDATNPLLVFEDCLQGLHNPLTYYARNGTGTSVSVSRFVLGEQRAGMEAARREGRPVYVALCTGHSNPWYALDQWEGRRGLVQVSP